MTLRRLAGESWKRPHFASVRELIASPVATCCMMISRSTSRARVSRSSPLRSKCWAMAGHENGKQSRCPTANRQENVGIAPEGVKIALPFAIMKRLTLIAFLLAMPALGVTVDRIAAVIDQQVLTVSEVDQLAQLRFFPRVAGRSDDDYRHNILEGLIAQSL